MKRFAGIGLRVVGLALVVLVLSRIQYRDLLGEEGAESVGTVVLEGEGARFEILETEEVIDLGRDWRARSDVTLGLFTIVRLSQKLLLGLCVLSFGAISLISITRWWYLLRKIDVPIRYGEAFRLTFIGFFFNNAVPGLTGGDLVKAYYIARQKPGARAKAFMSVLVDRVIGLFALGLLSGIAVLPHLKNPELRPAGTIVYAFLGACLLFGVLTLSRRLRRATRLGAIVDKLPFARLLREIGQGVFVYREVPGAVVWATLLSLLNHVSLVLMAIGMGRALGIDIPASKFFILFPVCMMVASIPMLPGGWGLREFAFAAFFGTVGVPPTLAVTLSIVIGLSQLFWSLLGGVFFMASPDRASAEDLRTFSDEVEAEVEQSPDAGS